MSDKPKGRATIVLQPRSNGPFILDINQGRIERGSIRLESAMDEADIGLEVYDIKPFNLIIPYKEINGVIKTNNPLLHIGAIKQHFFKNFFS